MPEITEYEKLKYQLARAWLGRKITRITAPASSPNPKKYFQGDWKEFRDLVIGKKIEGIARRGKNLLVVLAGPPYRQWHIHLSSTGWFMPGNELAHLVGLTDPIHKNFIHKINPANIRVKFYLDDGQIWNYHDPRTWGKWHLRVTEDSYWKTLGPDWIEDKLACIKALRDAHSGQSVKTVLTDQHVTAGLGNYLACEACYLAGIHPHRRYETLSKIERLKLGMQVGYLLRTAIECNDHSYWQVFKKRGQECPKHPGTHIRYAKDGKGARRGSYYCPKCQPLEKEV